MSRSCGWSRFPISNQAANSVRGWNPGGGRHSYVVQNVQTGSGANPASCSKDTRGSCPVVRQPLRIKLTTHLHLMPVKNKWRYTSIPPTCLHDADREDCISVYQISRLRIFVAFPSKASKNAVSGGLPYVTSQSPCCHVLPNASFAVLPVNIT
jgi:hypothetical protein